MYPDLIGQKVMIIAIGTGNSENKREVHFVPRKGVTIYSVLVSCPGDVLDYMEAIEESVGNFNRTFGPINNIEVAIKHWSTDSYPQSGDRPQELLNKQLVRDCDAAIAIFWTRFGSPTGKYDSGTEEEIEEMLAMGKQVFMYFLEAPVTPSDLNMHQYQKVLDFKENYKDKGIYATVKDKHEFQRELTNHLGLYLLQQIVGKEDANTGKAKPILKIRDINAPTGKDCVLHKYNLCDSRFMDEKKGDIVEKIRVLKNTSLPVHMEIQPKSSKDVIEGPSSLLKTINIETLGYKANMLSGTIEDVVVGEDRKAIINGFLDAEQIAVDDDFWNLGTLKKRSSPFAAPLGYRGPLLEGTEEEQERYGLLKTLYQDVQSYNEYKDYFSYLDRMSVAKLAVTNVGRSHDEDIDVRLMIPKGCLVKYGDLSYPGRSIIKTLLQMKFANFIFSIDETDTVEEYGYYPLQPPTLTYPAPLEPFYKADCLGDYENCKREYLKALSTLFLYKVFENEENDILIFHVDYLKHNTSMAFPSVLIFEDAPAYIEYEISSKYIPEVQKGRLKFEQ